jgi:hypothetical protein
MATSKTVDETATSPEAEAMVKAGAKPSPVDVNALLDQIQRLQAQMDAVNADRGIPSDPVGAAVKNLTDHVAARLASSDQVDLKNLADALKKLSENDGPYEKDVALISDLVEEAIDNHPQRFHDFHYLRILARDLRKAVNTSA